MVDLTIARAGPQCVRQLADWGADVVRVEPPSDPAGVRGSDARNLHRNKRTRAARPEGRWRVETLLRLVDRADVLVENMRPSVKHKLGFGWEVVHARNPRLVYGSISGFGQDGPYAERGGVDQIAQGMGGLMSVTGLPHTEPTRVGIPVSDLAAGLHLAIGILVALHERDRTGVGRWVRTSLLETMISMMDLQAVRWTIDGEVPVQEGNHHPTLVPMGCFRSKDGWVNIAGPSGRLLHRFCAAIDLPDLPRDPRFDSGAKRSANRAALNEHRRRAARSTHHGRVGRRAQRCRRALRARLLDGRGVRRRAGAAPRHGRPRRDPQPGDDGRRHDGADRGRGRAPRVEEVLRRVGVTDTGTEQLLCDVDDGIALVTFNNPTKHNALSAPIRDALPRVLRALQADDAVRVVVLTGAGGKAFVSGADISEFGIAAHDAGSASRRSTPAKSTRLEHGSSSRSRSSP